MTSPPADAASSQSACDRPGAANDPPPDTGLSPAQCEALVRAIEAAPAVQRRHQFFIWSQGPLQSLLPHRVAVCGAYQRQRNELDFDAFHSVVLPGDALALLGNGRSALMRDLSRTWVNGGGRALRIDLARACKPSRAIANGAAGCAGPERELLLACGLGQWLVHGVSRPERAHEIESLFLFATPGARSTREHALRLELLLPLLHSVWRRVQALESNVRRPGPPSSHEGRKQSVLSARERQILAGLCKGLSNQHVGERLGISPLTVKNHVQSILRKLGAANRTEAVARAMSLRLSGGEAPDLLP
jgi:transcriptional regulator EpsA